MTNDSNSKELRNFSFKLLLAATLLFLATSIIAKSYLHQTLDNSLFTITFFALLTFGIHYLLVKASKKRPQQFIAYFMGSMAIKLFVSFGFMVVYILLKKAGAVPYIIIAFASYMLFTIIQVMSVLKYLRASSK